MAISEKEFTQIAHGIGSMEGFRSDGVGFSPKISMLKLLATYSEPGLTITVEEDKKTGAISWKYHRSEENGI